MAVPAHLDSIIRFHNYQRQWLEDDARFKIGMFARQTGKTFTTCAEIVDDCIQAEIEGRRTRWVILSRGERQASEAMNEAVKPFVKAFYAIYEGLLKGAAPEVQESVWTAESGATYRQLEVEFPGGSKITALPANPDTARGYSANVFLDEFAFHQNSREIWRALFPVISKGGLKLRITSTPNGKGNKFYELWTAAERGEEDVWSRHRVDIHDAVADGLDRDIAMLRAGIADEDAWAQEYELVFLEDAGAWLSWQQIIAAEHRDAGEPAGYQGGPVWIGNDIARRKDLWVAWVWEQLGDTFWCREIVELKGASFAAQDAALDLLVDRYNPVRIVMDQTGMGEKPVEDAQRRYGKSRVEGVLLSAPRRLDVASHGRQAFEDRRVRIPAGRRELRADLHALKAVIGLTGTPRLYADRDEDGHADRTWAAFLGLAGAASGPMEFGYQPAPRRRASHLDERPAETGRMRMRPEMDEIAQPRMHRGAW